MKHLLQGLLMEDPILQCWSTYTDAKALDSCNTAIVDALVPAYQVLQRLQQPPYQGPLKPRKAYFLVIIIYYVKVQENDALSRDFKSTSLTQSTRATPAHRSNLP
jgi:hypothetical protein